MQLVLRLLLGVCVGMAGVAHARPVPAAAAGLLNAHTCLVTQSAPEVCTLHPAYTFSSQAQAALKGTPDRVYQAIMAPRVLCQQRTNPADCLADAASLCAWDAQRERCQADKHNSLLLPLTCPDSQARSFLSCQLKSGNAAACSRDPACTTVPRQQQQQQQAGPAAAAGAGWGDQQQQQQQPACYARWLTQQAAASNRSVQAVAEASALALLRGDTQLLGSCEAAALLARLLAACPFGNTWNACDSRLCSFDVPGFIPNRVGTQQQAQVLAPYSPPGTGANLAGSSSNSSSSASSQPQELTYYGAFPAPVCFVDTGRLPALLPQLLGVSAGLVSALAAGSGACSGADSISYDAVARVGYCGAASFAFSPAAVADALQL